MDGGDDDFRMRMGESILEAEGTCGGWADERRRREEGGRERPFLVCRIGFDLAGREVIGCP